MTSRRTVPTLPAPRRAFTLMEMMVVLLILAVVMAIVVPVLGNARATARRSATQTMLAGLSTSVDQFNIDERRLPGLFTARQIGSRLNAQGITAMDNIIFDLAGGVVAPGTQLEGEGCDARVFDISPDGGATQERIAIDRIGAAGTKGESGKAYFQPDPKFFTPQCGDGKRLTGENEKYGAIPALIDAFGQPILAWAADDVQAGANNPAFASPDSDRARARFYWASNSAFLGVSSLGRYARSQHSESAIGSGTPDAVRTLEALLGNPLFPADVPAGQQPRPAEPRAPIMFHCAGPNGVFVGREERAVKLGNGVIRYAPNQDVTDGGGLDDFFVTAGK